MSTASGCSTMGGTRLHVTTSPHPATFPCPSTSSSARTRLWGTPATLSCGHWVEGAQHMSGHICWGCGTPQWAHRGLLPHAGVGQHSMFPCHGSAAADPCRGWAANTRRCSAATAAKGRSSAHGGRGRKRNQPRDGCAQAGKGSMPAAPALGGQRCHTQAPSSALGVGAVGRLLAPAFMC